MNTKNKANTKPRLIRTDLANEAFEQNPNALGVKNIQEMPYENINIEISRVEIQNAAGARALGKPIGNYITIDAPDLLYRDIDYVEKTTKIISQELSLLINNTLEERDTVLIIGLGNKKITPDALGPKVAEKVLVSRHITEYLPEIIDDRARPVCALAPGVLGITGIETGEVVRGVAKLIKPKLIIAIDSLASRSTERISTAIQMTNTGIRPGGGVGNKRMELSAKTMGVPVIAIGIPTVVHASTISQDAIEMLLEEMGQPNNHELINIVEKLMSEKIGPLVVTPKDIDQIVDSSSNILANAIDMALHNVALEEIRSLVM